MKKLAIISITTFVGLMSLTGCSSPTGEDVGDVSSAMDKPASPLADPDVVAALAQGDKNDVIIVRRSAKTDLVQKLIDAGGKAELNVGKGSPLQGALEGKFKMEDLTKLVVKDELIIVVLQKGTGGKAAEELFRSEKVKKAIDESAEKQLEQKKDAPAAPPAPPSGGMGME